MVDVILQQKTEEGILILTLNRPKEMNCMNFDMIETLGNIIKESNFDMSLRVIIITGAKPMEGGKASFSAGADLAERRTLTDDQVRRFIATVRGTMITVENARVPVIAAIKRVSSGSMQRKKAGR